MARTKAPGEYQPNKRTDQSKVTNRAKNRPGHIPKDWKENRNRILAVCPVRSLQNGDFSKEEIAEMLELYQPPEIKEESWEEQSALVKPAY